MSGQANYQPPDVPTRLSVSLTFIFSYERTNTAVHTVLMTTVLKVRFFLCDNMQINLRFMLFVYRGADKSLTRPGTKQATATEDFDVHISYL